MRLAHFFFFFVWQGVAGGEGWDGGGLLNSVGFIEFFLFRRGVLWKG